jgi:oligopeptide transport system substrate-binding protein
MKLMSKFEKCMHQVPEIVRVAGYVVKRRAMGDRSILRCSIAICLISLFAVAGCGDHRHAQGATGDLGTGAAANAALHRVLRRGLPGDPRTLDPQLVDDDFSFQVVRDLYEGLTAEDSSGRIIPGAADSWTVDATGTIYVFHLRPNAKWSNGDRTLAAEFVDGLRRAVDPNTASGSAELLGVIKGASEITAGHKEVSSLGVSAIDESSVRIELEHPAPFVLQVLSQPIAAPYHRQPSGAEDRIYNGAYVLNERVSGSHIDLTRNQKYWNASAVAIERVRYVNLESEATELRAYMAGELDMTFTIPMPDLARLSQKFASEIQMAPTLGTSYLALNLTKAPLKNNAALREALSIALDRDLIADHVMVGVTPAYTLVADGTAGYDSPKYEWVSWSRDRQLTMARALFAQAGYTQKNPLHLQLYFSSGEGIQRIMIAVAGSWKQNLGITSDLVSDEFRVFLANRKDRSRWDVVRLKWDADYNDPTSFLDAFANDSNQNDPGYTSDSFNQLLAQARTEPQADLRLSLLRKAEQVLLNDYPIIPIYFTKSRRLVKPYVGGAQISPMNRIYSKNLFWK